MKRRGKMAGRKAVAGVVLVLCLLASLALPVTAVEPEAWEETTPVGVSKSNTWLPFMPCSG